MTTSAVINQGLSLHEFRVIVDSNNSNNDNHQKQKDLLQAIGVDVDFNNEISTDIRNKCKCIGQSGWVISPFWKPNIEKGETWYNTWYAMLNKDSPNNISAFFKQDNYKLLNDVRAYSRFEVSNYMLWVEAETLFLERHFTSCAMLLTAILEESIRKCPISIWRAKVTVFFHDAIQVTLEDYYKSNTAPLSGYIDTVLLLPSIDGFIDKYFNSKLRLENGVEPNYLERNWLMHGLMKREVNEDDCIKLFNAICSLTYVLNTVFHTDYRQ